jgi:hypothetical protein
LPYEVIPYSIENLKQCFVNAAYDGSKNQILSKHHFICFENYFKSIKTQTIVVEKNYINREYLEDYASYYVRSFNNYERKCTRLHFFGASFNDEQFKQVLRNDAIGYQANELQTGYHGFIVLKKLPKTIIGKTCLITYSHEGFRYFPSIRKYFTNLYGIPLEVESLAYQEQDSIVAACASSAIWSALHGTGILFQHSLPSPVEITRAATKHFPFSNRHFPNKGLTPEQMALTIREVGLEPFLYNAETYDRLKATLYAYLMGKIPVIVGYGVWDTNDNSPKSPAKFIGKHAVLICGFSLNGPLKDEFDGITNLSLTSSRINKIYVHDDQIGPFAKMEFNSSVIQINKDVAIEGIDTTARDKNGTIDKIKALPDMLIIPLYHKIRIPFDLILKVVNSFNGILDMINKTPSLPTIEMFEWDIFLSKVQDFKKEIFSDSLIACDGYKESILTAEYPRFIWRARGSRTRSRVIEFIFDATDIDQGDYFMNLIVYDFATLKQMKLLFNSLDPTVLNDLNLSKIFSQIQSHSVK